MDKDIIKRLTNWRKSSKTASLGIYLGPDVAWVHQPKQEESDAVDMTFSLANDDWVEVFSNITKSFGPAKLQILLSSDWYQLLQVDKPVVEPEEMNQALLWAVKNMVTVPVHNLHLDYFESPLGNQPKVTVAIVNKQQLQQMVHAAIQCRCEIAGITIEEMVVSNLLSTESQARLVISHYANQDLLFTVVRDGEPYMHRRVRGFSDIDTISAQDLAYGVADNLSLELQRSMDYFESQQRQPPVAAIDILIDGACEPLAQLLSANFNQNVNPIHKTSVGNMMASLAYAELAKEKNS